ncbi:MAG: Multidrug export protein EmrA [Variovorax sp.]|nr:MAG: Multidrug export protein EmrA [Variovorax sp.]
MSDNNTQTTAAPSSAAVPEAGNGKRRRALTALTAAVVVVGGGWGLYEWLVASHYEDTDNAYVQGNVIQITPQIGGTVMAINADDTDYVKAGQPLVQLDPADAKVALEQAEAALAQTVRQTRMLYANNGSLAAQVTLRQSDIVKAQSASPRPRTTCSAAARCRATARCRRKNSTMPRPRLPTPRARWPRHRPA